MAETMGCEVLYLFGPVFPTMWRNKTDILQREKGKEGERKRERDGERECLGERGCPVKVLVPVSSYTHSPTASLPPLQFICPSLP